MAVREIHRKLITVRFVPQNDTREDVRCIIRLYLKIIPISVAPQLGTDQLQLYRKMHLYQAPGTDEGYASRATATTRTAKNKVTHDVYVVLFIHLVDTRSD